MMQRQRGFGLGFGGSWFETIGMPLAVVAVLVVVSIPYYLDHRTKLKIRAGLAHAASARAAVEKAFAARGPADMSLASTTGWSAARGEGVPSIESRGRDSGKLQEYRAARWRNLRLMVFCLGEYIDSHLIIRRAPNEDEDRHSHAVVYRKLPVIFGSGARTAESLSATRSRGKETCTRRIAIQVNRGNV